MTIQMILAPLFVQVLLTFVIGFWMAGLRTGALTRREVKPRDIDLRQPNWPPRATQVANCFQNQFELPVLFYVLTILAIMTRHADFLFVVLAWMFVLTRVVHAYVHVTSNNLRMRGALVRRRRACAVHHVGDLHRAHPARPAMTPGARLAAAIEVVADIDAASAARGRRAQGLGG